MLIVRCNAAKWIEYFTMDRTTLAFITMAVCASVSADAAAQARLSREDCRRVTAHVPAPSVAFQPGVGAGGRRVAPADLSPPQAIVPQTPAFVLGVDLQRRLGLAPDLKADLPLGIVSLDGNRVLFNGRPLGNEDAAALEAACAQARRQR